jgi:hypothetical protein
MKKLPALFLAGSLAVFSLAEDAAKKAAPASAASAPAAAATIPASAAKLTAPLALKDGVISQPAQTELAEGGKAVFDFTVEKPGTYVIHAVVDGSAEDSNSFYLNIDAPPEDPVMIWDIDVTSGFEERVVSWRGSGDAENDEFKPKKFQLTAGAHKLIIVGREPAKLKSVSIRPASK